MKLKTKLLLVKKLTYQGYKSQYYFYGVRKQTVKTDSTRTISKLYYHRLYKRDIKHFKKGGEMALQNDPRSFCKDGDYFNMG